MPNLPISGLTASASNAAATDVLPVVQTTGTGPVKMTVQQMAGGLLGSTTLSGATITASQPVLDLSQTWNASGVTFTGLKFNAAGSSDANSAAGSLLMDLQVGGTSQFKISKTGQVQLAAGSVSVPSLSFEASSGFYRPSASSLALTISGGAQWVQFGNLFRAASSMAFGWASGEPIGNNIDTILTRRAAANLRLGAADAAGSAISISSVASNQLTLASNHGLSNGAAVQVTFTAGGAVPAGTAVNTTYYARSISAAVLELYGTYDQALNTASTTGRVNVTSAGTTAFINRAAPFQTLSVQSFTGTDIPGQPFVITGSQGTGTGAGGSIIFQVAPAGSSGTAQNALVDALTIGSDKAARFTGDILGLGGTKFNTTGTTYSYGFYISGGPVFGMGLYYVGLASNSSLRWSSTTDPNGAHDIFLARDAANTLALRNGANAQTFRVYNTTDGTNSEFGKIAWSSNVLQIGTEKAGTGTARALELQTDGTTRLTISTAGNATVTGWIKSNLYFDAPAALLGGNGGIYFGTAGANGSQVQSTGAGVIALGNYGGSDFNRIQFGGTTSSFPALKRSSTTLQARLADDSAFAGFASANMQAATAYTVASLPTPATGMIARVTDALAPTIGATVTGGGAAYALVNYNGANWTVIGV